MVILSWLFFLKFPPSATDFFVLNRAALTLCPSLQRYEMTYALFFKFLAGVSFLDDLRVKNILKKWKEFQV